MSIKMKMSSHQAENTYLKHLYTMSIRLLREIIIVLGFPYNNRRFKLLLHARQHLNLNVPVF